MLDRKNSLPEEQINSIVPEEKEIEELYSVDYIREPLLKMQGYIKDIGHILYRYREERHPITNKIFYNSYNHYYKVIKDSLKLIEDVSYFGTAFNSNLPDNNKYIRYELRANMAKIRTFCFNLEPLSMEDNLRNKLGSDSDKIKNLNLQLFDTSNELYDSLHRKNYFVLNNENEGIDDLFNFPEVNI